MLFRSPDASPGLKWKKPSSDSKGIADPTAWAKQCVRSFVNGMKVLQFAFSGGDSEYLPHNHVKNSVVYPGTHDNTTLTDWWENGASEKEKAAAAAYLHLTGVKPTAKELAAIRTDDVRIALLRAALGSVADRAIIPMYDWLGLGAEAHLNTPGKLGGNWAWRAADGFAAKALAKTIHDECSVYCRV